MRKAREEYVNEMSGQGTWLWRNLKTTPSWDHPNGAEVAQNPIQIGPWADKQPSCRQICISVKVFFCSNSLGEYYWFNSRFHFIQISLRWPCAALCANSVWHHLYPPLRDKIITKCTRQSPTPAVISCGILASEARPVPIPHKGKLGKTYQNFRGMSEWTIKNSASEVQHGSTLLSW